MQQMAFSKFMAGKFLFATPTDIYSFVFQNFAISRLFSGQSSREVSDEYKENKSLIENSDKSSSFNCNGLENIDKFSSSSQIGSSDVMSGLKALLPNYTKHILSIAKFECSKFMAGKFLFATPTDIYSFVFQNFAISRLLIFNFDGLRWCLMGINMLYE
jgi:hypothetical protein